jgi:hypothetical protein
VSELINLTCGDVALGTGAHVRCALALVVWYLMAPPAFPGRADMPLSENMRADRQFDEHADR